jgi:hypothetical protein
MIKLTDTQPRSIANKLIKIENSKRSLLVEKLKKDSKLKAEVKRVYKEITNLSKEARNYVGNHVNEDFIFNQFFNKAANKIPYVVQQDIIDKVVIATIDSEDLSDVLKKLGIKDFKI